MIWDQILKAKQEEGVVWLNFANAYGSIPHQLINYALEFFPCIKNLIGLYFRELQLSFAPMDFTTRWQRLEVGIAMESPISLILFGAALKVILSWGSQRLPPLRSYSTGG